MPVSNAEVAERFERVADLLEIEGANPFRVRAYRTAARSIRSLPRRLSDLVAEQQDLSRLPGIGRDLAGKIEEIVRTGRLGLLRQIERRTAPGLADLLRVPGLGPKRARRLHEELGISSLRDLARAAREQRIRRLSGFGARSERAILEALEVVAGEPHRFRWQEAEAVAASLAEHLERLPGVEQVAVAGSFRRRQETVGDLDVLVTCAQGTPVGEHFTQHEDVAKVLSGGPTRTSVRLRSGLQVDLRVVAPESAGAALLYFTGSKAHNIAVRKLGVARKLKINEYGVFRGPRRIAGRTEAEIYRGLGLRYIEPELREDRGEIEAARRGRLPRLVALEDLRGDLHCHTRTSDGRSSLEQMAAAAAERGYRYLAISEHTRALAVAHGLSSTRLRRHLARIERVSARQRGLVLLKAAEVEILEDGSLDLPDEVLAELDLVIGAVHSHFGLNARQQTERILRALDHPRLHLLAHPSGRRIGSRPPLALDLERVIAGAAERGCFLELNGQPERLDLTDVACQTAKDCGAKVALCSDAHSTDELDFLRLAVGQARRGWLEPDEVVNTRTWPQLRRLLRSG